MLQRSIVFFKKKQLCKDIWIFFTTSNVVDVIVTLSVTGIYQIAMCLTKQNHAGVEKSFETTNFMCEISSRDLLNGFLNDCSHHAEESGTNAREN
jgi:hypothetical protein